MKVDELSQILRRKCAPDGSLSLTPNQTEYFLRWVESAEKTHREQVKVLVELQGIINTLNRPVVSEYPCMD